MLFEFQWQLLSRDMFQLGYSGTEDRARVLRKRKAMAVKGDISVKPKARW